MASAITTAKGKMITTSNENNIRRHGVQCEGSFNIKTTGKAFRILSDGLYSDKITAIIRELSCNAYDAHVQAGKADVPFMVQLPNTFEPVFKVKDTGIGLCHDDVVNLYTTYFESTKNDSNDFVGCLGLGSKSPFSYISSFNIISNFDGDKRQYNAFINENDVPTIALMTESYTDEENGLEISFNVKTCDCNEFKRKAENVYKYFKTKPIVTGVDDFSINEVSYVLQGVKWGLRDDGSYGARAIMGNVCYPIIQFTTNNEADDCISNMEAQANINKLMELPIDVFFDIGDLEVAASRESLSYNKHTINSISIRFKNLVQEINANVHSAIQSCSTLWDARITISHLMKDQYRSLKNLISNENFNWKDITIEGFSNIVNIPIDLYSEVTITRFAKKNKRNRHSYSTSSVISQDVGVKYLYCDNDSTFLWKDISTGSMKRCKQLLNENENLKCVYLVSSKTKELMGRLETKTEAEKLENLKSFEEFLGTSIKPVSSIVVDKTRYSSSNINYKKNNAQFIVYDYSKYDSNTPSSAWEPITIDIKDNYTTRIYVYLDRYCIGSKKAISYIADHKTTLRLINEVTDFEIIGVKSKSIHLVKNKPNWISLNEYVRNMLVEYVNKNDIAYTISNMEKIREFNRNPIAKELIEIYEKNYSKVERKNKKSPIRSLLLKTKMVKRSLKNKTLQNIENIAMEVRNYNIELKSKTRKDIGLAEEIENVFNHYPLIRVLQSSYYVRNYPKEIMHYINAVDINPFLKIN
jgi:hypothetical protein